MTSVFLVWWRRREAVMHTRLALAMQPRSRRSDMSVRTGDRGRSRRASCLGFVAILVCEPMGGWGKKARTVPFPRRAVTTWLRPGKRAVTRDPEADPVIACFCVNHGLGAMSPSIRRSLNVVALLARLNDAQALANRSKILPTPFTS